jgi:RecA-family ATPase
MNPSEDPNLRDHTPGDPQLDEFSLDSSETRSPDFPVPAGAKIHPLRAHNFAELGDVPPPPREWLVEGLIPFGTVTFISGDGGVGKTLLGQQLIMAAALGLPWIGRPTKQAGSIALFCEDEATEIHRRALGIAQHHGVTLKDPRLRAVRFLSEVGEDNALTRFSWSEGGSSPYQTSRLYETIRDWAVQRRARLVLLDSLHDVFIGNENYRPEAKAFVRALSLLAQAIDGAVVVLAHPSMTGLQSGSGTSGSTAWNNAVRSRLYLTRREPARGGAVDGTARVLKTMKANYGAIGDSIALRWEGGVFRADEPPSIGEVCTVPRDKGRRFPYGLRPPTRS